jgi:hypothetical protein
VAVKDDLHETYDAPPPSLRATLARACVELPVAAAIVVGLYLSAAWRAAQQLLNTRNE